jgi:hypothetical protein
MSGTNAQSAYGKLDTIALTATSADAIQACTPCWLQRTDSTGQIVQAFVSYQDCPAGKYREYYPSGQLKVSGLYQENATKDWIPGKTCGVKTGTWTYYKADGTIHYDETWSKGRFLEQHPNLGRSEIWTVDLSLGGGAFDPRETVLRYDLLTKLVIAPRYKNANRKGSVTGQLTVSEGGLYPKSANFDMWTYRDVDLDALLPDGEFDNSKLLVRLEVFVDGVRHTSIPLRVYR